MVTKKIFVFGLSLLVCLLPAWPAMAQIIYGQPGSGSTGLVHTSWKLEDTAGVSTTISQFWIPLNGFIPLKDNLEARFYIANASSNLDLGDSESDMSGLSDVRIQLSRSVSDDQLLLSAGVNLPTGKRKLSLTEERPIIELLAQSFLDFPMRRYGEGFGFNVLLGAARQLGEINASGGIMYELIGKYEPYENVNKYDPGDIISANVGAELPRGPMTWTANAVFSTFLTDKSDGVKVFKQGQQLDLQLAGRHASEKSQVDALVRYLVRGRNERYDAATEQVRERLKLYGNEFQVALKVGYNLSADWHVAPSASLRLIAGNEEDFGSSNVLAFGGALGRKLGEQFGLELGFKYLTGQADDNNIDLSGIQVISSLRASF